ncbi:MAG: TIR domain-containing protein [Bacteroidota bacterium]
MSDHQDNNEFDFLPDLPDYGPKPADGYRVNDSPVPGLTLRRILRGHEDAINRIAWSPDGRFLASPADDQTIRIWGIASGECLVTLLGHTNRVMAVTWSPDGKRLASCSLDRSIRIWDTGTWEILHTLPEHDLAYQVVWSPDGLKLASCHETLDETIRVWDTETWELLNVLKGHDHSIIHVTWSVDGKRLASSSMDKTIRVWDAESWVLIDTLTEHTHYVNYSAWSPDGQRLVSSSDDKTIRIWHTETWNLLDIIEGHESGVTGVTFSRDGWFLASTSDDDTVRLWRTDSWDTLANINLASDSAFRSVSFHPTLPYLAVTGQEDRVLFIWELDKDTLLGNVSTTKSVRYTTAKIVLVGDSGVGKTGLGWRLAHDEFKEQASTHGQQFWVIDELGLTREDGTECEAVLWDLAGQADYRIVHSLFLDDVDTALVLFDPTNRQEPLSGVDFWLNQLRKKEQDLCKSILVGARIDRGTSTLTQEELDSYCVSNDISGGYTPTSAYNGEGIAELQARLKANIPWGEMPATVTTRTFKRIKEHVLGLKEQPERKQILVQPDELRSELQATDASWEFTDSEMMAAVGHLATHGYVRILTGSDGGTSILLVPNLLINLAASIVLEARRNPKGLGVLEEDRLLAGGYRFQELHDLEEEEKEILLDAAAVLFLEKNVCFREIFNQQTFLVFPSLINQKRPKDQNIDIVEGASYRIMGAVENLYASLVVLLGYTNTFIRTNHWQNQAQYEMGEGEICGFEQTDFGNGEIEVVLYYVEATPEPVRLTFRGLFERFLSRRNLEVSRYQPVICPECSSQLARNVVLGQLAKKKDFSFCHECGYKLSLPNPEPLTRLSRKQELVIDDQQMVAQRRTAFESSLVRIKALLRDKGEAEAPSCFISYAWGVKENESWVLKLAKDLRNAGIQVLLDRWHSTPGSDLGRYIDQIEKSDFVIVVGTPELKEKYDSETDDRVVAAELELVNFRARQPKKYGRTILPLLLGGNADESLPAQLQRLVSIDFRVSELYFRQLFDMIWRIYDLPFDHPMLEELRDSMSPRRE